MDKLNKKFGVTRMKRVLKKGIKIKRKLSPKAKQLRQGLFRIYKIKLKPGTNVMEAISEYKKDPNVEYAEPNYIFQINSTTPNDPSFSDQWGLNNTGQTGGTSDADIDAPEAWDIETGDSNVVIAVIDTGVDWDHPDLATNIWTNSGEIEGNGIDDDGNGYEDDYRGWDFVTVGSGTVYSGEDPGPADNDPMDFQGHGTHVSGIIGAATNNSVGIAGVAWNCKIMAVRAGYKNKDGDGSLNYEDTGNAIVYATDNGAHIINMSFSSSIQSSSIKDAIDYAYAAGVILIAASGNDGGNLKSFPAAYDEVIAVGATDHNDNIADFSNWGYWIDIAAPGVSIYSTYFNNTYKSLSGTSMAAPHVSGLAGLILSQNPDFSNEEVRQALRISADDLGDTGLDQYFGYGRINAFNGVQLNSVCVALIDSVIVSGTADIIGTASGTNFDHYDLYYGEGVDPTSWTQIGTTSYSEVVGDVLTSWDTTTVSDGQYTLKLVVVDSDSNEFIDRKVVIVDNEDSSYVPDDFPTIQSAIDGSANGNTVIVKSGTYYENINFNGKAITVRSENGPNATIIDGSRNGSVVTFWSEEDENSVLDGLTIRSGWAFDGGGIYCYQSSPTISNCIIKGNTAYDNGGGVYYYESSPTITNCTISGNLADKGGGIYCENSSPTITSCYINDNMSYEGGGIYCGNSSPLITNSTLIGNSVSYGGGIYCSDSSPTITNSTFSLNSASSNGGGIYLKSSPSTVTIINSIIWENTAPTSGRGHEIFLYYGDPSLIDITYSDIKGGWSGDGNIDEDPLFVDPDKGNYYLQSNSPCIDTGTSSDALDDDIEEITRPQDGDDLGAGTTGDGSDYDMGAYEYVGPASCDPRAFFTASSTTGTDILTVNFDASSSGGSQYSGATFSWDFGDGTPIEFGETASHLYTAIGKYDVSTTITTSCGSHTFTLYDLVKITSSTVTKEVGPGYEYTSIQDAIDDAEYGEFILVHDGTYVENINFHGKGITVKSENGPEVTIIDGNQSGSVVTFYSGEDENSVLDGFKITNGNGSTFGYNSGGGINCYQNSSPKINNCIITDNKVSVFNSGVDFGGGISCDINSSPTIANCIIRDNKAIFGGGIVCDRKSSPKIINCEISENVAHGYRSGFGGGIHCNSNSSPLISNCSINQNTATYFGGGILDMSSATIENSTINSNSAGMEGGGIYLGSSSPTITNCTISSNSSRQGGGIKCNQSSPKIDNCIISGNSSSGIHCEDSSPTITNCMINDNAAAQGGGIYCYSSSLIMTNCTVSGNLSDNSGGGIYFSANYYYNWNLSITNCVISGNMADINGGGIYWSTSTSPAIVTNSILWGDTAGGSPNEIHLADSSSFDVTYSNIEGGDPDNPGQPYPGEGNIDADPLFVNPRDASEAPTSDGDYHLTCNDPLTDCSPCIDTGDPDSAYPIFPPDDIEGSCRPYDGNSDAISRYDMGAYEYLSGSVTCTDEDSDYYYAEGCCGRLDCEDGDPAINPGVPEICDDGIDNDCDGETDECYCEPPDPCTATQVVEQPYNWIDVTDGTELSFISNDNSYAELTIPFSFAFFGSPKSTMKVSTNGYVTFGTYGTSYSNYCIPNSDNPNDFIAPFWDDLYKKSDSAAYFKVTGTEPNRILTIEWHNWGRDYVSSAERITFEVSLYESSNNIVFQYQDVSLGVCRIWGFQIKIFLSNYVSAIW